MLVVDAFAVGVSGRLYAKFQNMLAYVASGLIGLTSHGFIARQSWLCRQQAALVY